MAVVDKAEREVVPELGVPLWNLVHVHNQICSVRHNALMR